VVPHIEGRAEVNVEAKQVLFRVVGILEGIDQHPQLAMSVPSKDPSLLALVDDVMAEGMVHEAVCKVAGPCLVQ
jgi:hypothetical protein